MLAHRGRMSWPRPAGVWAIEIYRNILLFQVCYGAWLMLGTVGFFSSLQFVKYIYRSIKCD